MTLENEMRLEVKRIENRIFFINSKLKSIDEEKLALEKEKKRLAQDLHILKISLGMEVDEKEYQTTLYRLRK